MRLLCIEIARIGGHAGGLMAGGRGGYREEVVDMQNGDESKGITAEFA
jgi:hypothetical protein